jgi:pilus assembly protein CpaB
MTYRWLKARSAYGQGSETMNVAVAVTDLDWGTIIKPEMVKIVPFLKGSLTSGFFQDPASVAGRVVITPVKAGEPIFASRLASSDVTRGGVAAVISENKRAMGVKVDKVKGISGFIHPGNRVDVVATFKPAYSRAPVTMTVIENVPVLAVGTETELKNKQEKPSEVDVITLEVTPEQAEVLALAAAEGKLQLSLRNFSDTKNVSTSGATVQSLISLLSGKDSAPVRKMASRGKGTDAKPAYSAYAKVQLIEGQKVQDVNLRKEGSE